MINRIFRTVSSLLFVLAWMPLQAQPGNFKNDIDAFKRNDVLHPAPLHPILFIGSSSFRLWDNLAGYFPGYTILNRAFGGSTLPDVIYYANDVIAPYEAKQIVIYCGDNDLGASDTVTAEMVANNFKTLFNIIRKKDRKVPVVFVSIKPSPSRQHLMPKMEAANTLIKEFLKGKKNTAFVDVYHKMLNEDGTPMKDIFKPDNLHMNEKGYAIWKKELEPVLVK